MTNKAPLVAGVMAGITGLFLILIKKATAAPQPGVHTCPYCGERFDTYAELVQHILDFHPEIPPEEIPPEVPPGAPLVLDLIGADGVNYLSIIKVNGISLSALEWYCPVYEDGRCFTSGVLASAIIKSGLDSSLTFTWRLNTDPRTLPGKIYINRIVFQMYYSPEPYTSPPTFISESSIPEVGSIRTITPKLYRGGFWRAGSYDVILNCNAVDDLGRLYAMGGVLFKKAVDCKNSGSA